MRIRCGLHDHLFLLRRTVAALVGGLALLLITAPGAAQPAPSVEGVALTVEDMDRAVRFYSEVLSFQRVKDVEVTGAPYERLFGVFGLRMHVVTMRLGDERVKLIEFVAPSDGRPHPPDAQSNDLSFQHVAIIVRDMEAAYQQLRAHGVTHVSPKPQTLPEWNPTAGGISAFYFKDPSGNVLEILHFPPDKGAAKWHAPTNRLFLGIDHTAIVVDDTEQSLDFFRDRLGFRVAGTSMNYGIEQERLSTVFGARVRITALRAPRGGIGVEFLDYVAPSDGRPTPARTQANDLWHAHIQLRLRDAASAVEALRGAGYALVSPRLQSLPDAALGYTSGALVRGPDGHGVLLTE